MQPQNLRFGGGVTETVLNPFVFALILVVGVLVLALPRTKVIAPLIAAFILIPMDQVLLIGGMHFPMLRFLALFGFVRLVREKLASRKGIFAGGLNKIDLAVISFALMTGIAGVVLFQQVGALVYQLGNIYTIFGVYFLLRHLIRDESDVVRIICTLAYVAAVVAVVMTWEVTTGRNPYALLGGASADVYANVMARGDHFRATGCFAHPILAGTFGAIILPLFILLWQRGKQYRATAIVGIVSATVITLASSSSTPVLAYASGVVALCMWPLRNWMRAIRWGIVFAIAFLHLVMKAPVWHLIARIDVSGGSSSYHRFMIVDECIRHFSDWWLVGVKSTFEWGWDMWDTANQYVSICDSSGLFAFILFIASIVLGFRYLGKTRRSHADRQQLFFSWALGAALFANVVAFMGISYTDQIIVVWYGLLASISAVTLARLSVAHAPAETAARLSAPAWIPEPLQFDTENNARSLEPDSVAYQARQRFLAL